MNLLNGGVPKSTIFSNFVANIDQKKNKISEDWEGGHPPPRAWSTPAFEPITAAIAGRSREHVIWVQSIRTDLKTNQHCVFPKIPVHLRIVFTKKK
jgi:hypothetical protein